MRRLALALATALAATLLVATPAHAVSRVLVHYSPDDGYSPSIIGACSWTKRASYYTYLPTGTRMSCNTQGVYVRAGEELWCRETRLMPWVKVFDATGWHKATYWYTAGCTLRKD